MCTLCLAFFLDFHHDEKREPRDICIVYVRFCLTLFLVESRGLMRPRMIFRQGIVTAAVTAGLGWSCDLRNNFTTERGRERGRGGGREREREGEGKGERERERGRGREGEGEGEREGEGEG